MICKAKATYQRGAYLQLSNGTKEVSSKFHCGKLTLVRSKSEPSRLDVEYYTEALLLYITNDGEQAKGGRESKAICTSCIDGHKVICRGEAHRGTPFKM